VTAGDLVANPNFIPTIGAAIVAALGALYGIRMKWRLDRVDPIAAGLGAQITGWKELVESVAKELGEVREELRQCRADSTRLENENGALRHRLIIVEGRLTTLERAADTTL